MISNRMLDSQLNHVVSLLLPLLRAPSHHGAAGTAARCPPVYLAVLRCSSGNPCSCRFVRGCLSECHAVPPPPLSVKIQALVHTHVPVR